MDIETAMEEAGAAMMSMADRVAADRAAASGLNARAEELYCSAGGSIAGDFLRQRADDFLRAAARRERRAQAIQTLMDAARKAAQQEDANHVST